MVQHADNFIQNWFFLFVSTFEHQILIENIDKRICAWYSYLNYLKQFSNEELKENKVRLQTLYSRCLDKCKGILKTRPNDEKFTKIFIEYVCARKNGFFFNTKCKLSIL